MTVLSVEDWRTNAGDIKMFLLTKMKHMKLIMWTKIMSIVDHSHPVIGLSCSLDREQRRNPWGDGGTRAPEFGVGDAIV